MSIATLHTLAGINTAAGAIDQITDQSIDPGIEQVLESAGGQVNPSFAALMTQQPQIAFTCTDIANALGVTGMTGYAIAAAADLYWQKYEQTGTRAGALEHIKMSGSLGLIVPRTLEWGHNTAATLSCDIILISSDGTTAPYAITSSQTLPSFGDVSELFVAGPVSLNGAALTGIQSGSLDFGITLRGPEGSGGEVFNTFCAIESVAPRLTLTTTDALATNTLGVSGVAQGATDSVVYLRKVAENGARVSDVTAEHISLSIDDGRINPRAAGASHGGQVLTEIEITPTYDGANAIIALSTATAIT